MKQKSQIIRRVLVSVICVSLGWFAMSAFALIQASSYASISPRWYAVPLTISLYSIPYIAATWLVIVLPSCCFIPSSSRFWTPTITTLTFALVGFMIMATMTRFSYTVPIYTRIWMLATITGAVTGLSCSLMHRRKNTNKEAEQGGDGDAEEAV